VQYLKEHWTNTIYKKIIHTFLSDALDKIIPWCQKKDYRTDSMMDIKEFIQFLMGDDNDA